MVAMLLLALVFISSSLLDVWKKQQLADDLLHQQQALITEFLPDVVVDSQPKKQLIKALSNTHGQAGKANFIDYLHEYSSLKAGFSKVITNKIQYQKSRLVVNVEAADLKSLESFRGQLEKSRFKVQIENVNINPDKTTGRLVMSES